MMQIKQVLFLFFFPLSLFAQEKDSLASVTICDSRLQLTGTVCVPQVVFNTANSPTLPTLASIIAQGTGAAIKQYGIGGLTTFSLRGTSSHQNTILWNGFSLQNSMNGVTDLSLFQSGMLDKISVYSGGLSALYGGGTIGGALILEDQFNEKQGLHGRLYQAWSSWNNWQSMTRFDYSSDKYQLSARIGGAWNKNRYTYPLGKERLIQDLAHSTQQVTAIHQRFCWKKKHTLTLRSTFLESNRNLEPPITFAQVADYQYDLKKRLAADYQYVQTKSVSKIRILFNHETINYKSLAIKKDTNFSKSMVAELEQNRILTPSMTLNYGLHYKNDRAVTSNYTGWKQQERIAFWSVLHYATKQNATVLAIRQEVANKKRIPFVFSLGYRRNIDTQHSWSISSNRNYNVPTLNDLFWIDQGNPTLNAEDSWSAETRWETRFSQTSSIQITHYQMLVTNWIDWQPSSNGVWRPANLLKVWGRGLEFLARQQWFTNTNLKLNSTINYQLTLSTQQKNSNPALIGKQLAYIPRQQLGLNVELFYKKTYAQFRQTISSKRYTLMDNSNAISGYSIGNLTLGYNWRYFKSSIVIENLWNEKYVLLEYRPMPLRNMQIAVRYDF
jgi:vitamin B12 transporter